ncbi:MAG TPA: VWA domain-containing protein [Vicinamibacterales bacterium]
MSVRWRPAIAASMLVSLLTSLSASQQPAVESQAPARFKSAVDVVSVSAVVRDRKGRFVGDLGQKDFMVIEAGQSRPILDFRAESDGPVKVALLFDVSGSMRLGSKAVDARQAARHVFSALRPADEAAVFAFDTKLVRVKDFTSDLTALDASLDHVDPPFGQTSLYDAVAQTARAVADAGRGEGRLPQRSAVVVLTDGIDTRSRLTPEQVTTIASMIDVPVYVVAVMASIDDPRQADGERVAEISSALRNLSQWTGGELFTASAPAHANVAARQIVDELRHQYVLAFEASTTRGWRPLQVSARDRSLVVRARAGYNVGGDEASKFKGQGS